MCAHFFIIPHFILGRAKTIVKCKNRLVCRKPNKIWHILEYSFFTKKDSGAEKAITPQVPNQIAPIIFKMVESMISLLQ